MGRLRQLEIENFKSYEGTQVIGPFSEFTAVIGPNGAGACLVFAMRALASTIESRVPTTPPSRAAGKIESDGRHQLRARRAIAPPALATPQRPGLPRGRRHERARRASVKLVYEVAADEIEGATAGTEIWFGRTISASGAGSYRLNGREVSWEVYDKQLREIGVLVRARNFLVFQGDVESIAAKNPRELCVFFEQISGSEDSKAEYELLKGKKEAAEENTIHSFQKRKGYAAERKQVRTALRNAGTRLNPPLKRSRAPGRSRNRKMRQNASTRASSSSRR